MGSGEGIEEVGMDEGTSEGSHWVLGTEVGAKVVCPKVGLLVGTCASTTMRAERKTNERQNIIEGW